MHFLYLGGHTFDRIEIFQNCFSIGFGWKTHQTIYDLVRLFQMVLAIYAHPQCHPPPRMVSGAEGHPSLPRDATALSFRRLQAELSLIQPLA